jgi:hypothetical protein
MKRRQGWNASRTKIREVVPLSSMKHALFMVASGVIDAGERLECGIKGGWIEYLASSIYPLRLGIPFFRTHIPR